MGYNIILLCLLHNQAYGFIQFQDSVEKLEALYYEIHFLYIVPQVAWQQHMGITSVSCANTSNI